MNTMKENPFDIGNFVNVLTAERAAFELVERFKKRRREKGLSQRRIAELSGVSYASVRRFEASGEISLHALMGLASALGCLADFGGLFSHPIITDLKEYRHD